MRLRYVIISMLIGAWHNLPSLLSLRTLGAILVNLITFWVIGKLMEEMATYFFYVASGYMAFNILFLISIYVFNTLILYYVSPYVRFVFVILRLFLFGTSILHWGLKRLDKTPSSVDGTILSM